MAHPETASFPISAVNALVVGKSGAGKSTLCNLLLYDKDDVPDGFAVGDSPNAMTKQCVTKARCGLPTCLQVTDTPGVPDTGRRKTLRGYDDIIKTVRPLPFLNAIIIMVALDRADATDYRDWRASLRQFNPLPCAKVMVCRVNPLSGWSDKRRAKLDYGAMELMNNIAIEAGLAFVRPFILHNTNLEEIKSLRDMICSMPGTTMTQAGLLTYEELRSSYSKLSDAAKRMEELRAQIEDLYTLKTQNEKQIESLTQKVDGTSIERRRIAGAATFVSSAAAASDVVFLGLGTLFVGVPVTLVGAARLGVLSKNLSHWESEIEAARERVNQLDEFITQKIYELSSGRADPEELQRSRAMLRELATLVVN